MRKRRKGEKKKKGKGCMMKVKSVGVVKALVVISSSVKEDRVCSAFPQIYKRTEADRESNEISLIKRRTDGEEGEETQQRKL